MSQDTDTHAGDLTELDDPSLVTRWAEAREMLARTPTGSAGHATAKARYEAFAAEYRRRVADWP